jgi:type I restriction enzyme R subunit
VVFQLLHAHDPDTLESIELNVRSEFTHESPMFIANEIKQRHEAILNQAVAVFNNPDLRNYIIDVRKKYDQVIDSINIDSVTKSGWVKDQIQEAQNVVADFKEWIEQNKEEITALQIFYGQPYRRRELTFHMIKELSEQLLRTKPTLAPLKVWKAYEQLESVTGQPKNELIAMVALVRRVLDIDTALTPFDKIVDKNFADWVWKRQQGATMKFTKEHMEWLHLIKDHIATSVHLNTDDLDFTPFDARGGRGKMWQLFGTEMDNIIQELNEVLVA